VTCVTGGKRTSPLTTVNRSSTAIATRKKPEKSPPSQSIKTANKKWWRSYASEVCTSYLLMQGILSSNPMEKVEL